MIKQLWLDDSGSNVLEYGLIVGLVSVAAVAAASSLGLALNGVLVSLGHRAEEISAVIVRNF